MTADQLIQEAIIDLQRQDLCPDTRRLVEEAAQLLANGRDIEARALVEKAQAITVPDVHSKVNGVTKVNAPRAGERIEQVIISRVSSRLSERITSALTESMEELHLSFGSQLDDVVRSLESRLAGIASELKALSHLHERVERIEREEIARASAVQEQWEGLSASIISLQETDQRRRAEAEQFSRHISVEMETISSRVTVQVERLEGLNRLAQDLSSKVMSVAEQADRHTVLIRSMQERQAQRAAALNAVLDGIAKLREPKSLANEADVAVGGTP